jgi:hypothetical protein
MTNDGDSLLRKRGHGRRRCIESQSLDGSNDFVSGFLLYKRRSDVDGGRRKDAESDSIGSESDGGLSA